jgi:hypothetical protein
MIFCVSMLCWVLIYLYRRHSVRFTTHLSSSTLQYILVLVLVLVTIFLEYEVLFQSMFRAFSPAILQYTWLDIPDSVLQEFRLVSKFIQDFIVDFDYFLISPPTPRDITSSTVNEHISHFQIFNTILTDFVFTLHISTTSIIIKYRTMWKNFLIVLIIFFFCFGFESSCLSFLHQQSFMALLCCSKRFCAHSEHLLARGILHTA